MIWMIRIQTSIFISRHDFSMPSHLQLIIQHNRCKQHSTSILQRHLVELLNSLETSNRIYIIYSDANRRSAIILTFYVLHRSDLMAANPWPFELSSPIRWQYIARSFNGCQGLSTRTFQSEAQCMGLPLASHPAVTSDAWRDQKESWRLLWQATPALNQATAHRNERFINFKYVT